MWKTQTTQERILQIPLWQRASSAIVASQCWRQSPQLLWERHRSFRPQAFLAQPCAKPATLSRQIRCQFYHTKVVLRLRPRQHHGDPGLSAERPLSRTCELVCTALQFCQQNRTDATRIPVTGKCPVTETIASDEDYASRVVLDLCAVKQICMEF